MLKPYIYCLFAAYTEIPEAYTVER